jgi:hypothetical protein
MLKHFKLAALCFSLITASFNIMASLDVESRIRDHDEASLSKACVENWASSREASGTLTTYFIQDQGDRFWVKASALIDERHAIGIYVKRLIEEIDIHCNVTGKEKNVIEYRRKNDLIFAKKANDLEIKYKNKAINHACKSGFRDVFLNNTDWDKKWASLIANVIKKDTGRTLRIETLSASGKIHYSDVQCNIEGKFLRYKTIKITEPSIHGGYKTIKHKMIP